MGKKLTNPLPPRVATKKVAVKAPKKPVKYAIIRDTREKKGQGWFFRESELCSGTVKGTLPTGDYTIKGFEELLCVERKGTVGEFAKNICEARFWRELERMRSFPFAALILEFALSDVMKWPAGSGIPKWKWKYVRVSNKFILSSIKKIETEYPNIRVILAGPNGKSEAGSLFKEVIAHVAKSKG